MVRPTIAQPPLPCKPKMLKNQRKRDCCNNKTDFALSTAPRNSIIGGVPTICAIIPHFDSQERTLTCLNRVIQQTRRVDSVILVNNGSKDAPVLEAAEKIATQALPGGALHILQPERNLGNIGACARGMEHAFRTLKADYVWPLDDNTWARPAALEHLLAAETDSRTIRMCVGIDPAQGDELSRPLSLPGSTPGVWIPTARRSELPEGNAVLCRGGFFGALYPRSVWECTGAPAEELFTQGTDEYSWKLQQAGFSFATIMNAELELPAAAKALIHYRLANRSFFYEPGITVERQYYKMRNWAWLQRLRAPRNYLARLIHCGFYITLALWAMACCKELTTRRVYNLFRALHNGFYGKLRPY